MLYSDFALSLLTWISSVKLSFLYDAIHIIPTPMVNEGFHEFKWKYLLLWCTGNWVMIMQPDKLGCLCTRGWKHFRYAGTTTMGWLRLAIIKDFFSLLTTLKAFPPQDCLSTAQKIGKPLPTKTDLLICLPHCSSNILFVGRGGSRENWKEIFTSGASVLHACI